MTIGASYRYRNRTNKVHAAGQPVASGVPANCQAIFDQFVNSQNVIPSGVATTNVPPSAIDPDMLNDFVSQNPACTGWLQASLFPAGSPTASTCQATFNAFINANPQYQPGEGGVSTQTTWSLVEVQPQGGLTAFRVAHPECAGWLDVQLGTLSSAITAAPPTAMAQQSTAFPWMLVGIVFGIATVGAIVWNMNRKR